MTFDKELSDCRKSGGDCQSVIDKWKKVSDDQSQQLDETLKDNPASALAWDKELAEDNAAYEGFFGRLKTEMYYGHEWSGVTPEHFMQHVDAYIRWHNEYRIKLSLGALSTEMYRRQLGIAQ